MELKELLEFIDKQDGRLNQRFPSLDGEKRVLARAVKLSEEFGELCNDILGHASLITTEIYLREIQKQMRHAVSLLDGRKIEEPERM